MKIVEITVHPDWVLTILSDDGKVGEFNVKPYLNFEAFEELNSVSEFRKISNGDYFIEWDCGADLSADTIEANWVIVKSSVSTLPA